MTKSVKYIFMSMVFLIVSFASFSCQKKIKPLKPTAIKLIDTLVASEWKVLEPLQDSLCDVQKEGLFQQAYDSILQVRIQEKSELIQYEVQ